MVGKRQLVLKANKMRNRNNTNGLQREMAKKISQSKMWLVLRMDKDGVHLHMPNEDHMALFGVFFAGQPEILGMVNEFIKAHNAKP